MRRYLYKYYTLCEFRGRLEPWRVREGNGLDHAADNHIPLGAPSQIEKPTNRALNGWVIKLGRIGYFDPCLHIVFCLRSVKHVPR